MTELLKLDIDDCGIATVTLSRPEVHNAFNAELVAELSAAFDTTANENARVMVLTGQGASFSAGADLNWMRAMVRASESENRDDARRLAAMLRKLDQLHCPTIARVNGHAFGGAVGLIACCDLAVAVDTAKFGLTEVRLGLAPATIAPFVIACIGINQARHYMLTGERIDAQRAMHIGLVGDIVAESQLDDHIGGRIRQLLAGGPHAQAHCKGLIHTIASGRHDPVETDHHTAELIAALRVSREGQEGLNAFLEKRKPSWAAGDS